MEFAGGRILELARRRATAERGRRRARRAATSGAPLTGRVLVPILVAPMEGRTGSTLLMKLLSSSPEIVFDRCYPFENRYLTYFSRLLTPVGDPFEPGNWGMAELLEGEEDRIGPIPFRPLSIEITDLRRRAVRHVWAAFSEAVGAFAGSAGRYYAEKTWANNLELMEEAGISCMVVHLVRDPRDVVASIRAFDAKRGTFGFGRMDGQSDSEYLEFIVGAMRTKINAMLADDGRTDRIVVRYEDLVDDLDVVAARLAQWLQVKLKVPSPGALGREFERHGTSTSAATSVGRWRRELPAADVAVIERGLGELLEAIGYETG